MRDGGVPSEPFVLVEQTAGAARLAAVSRRAAALGLKPASTLADARARIPGLQAFDHDPAADAAVLRRMAAFCDRWTPLVSLDRPDGLVLDVTGCAHLTGGEPALRSQSLDWFRRAGFTARATLAGTPDAARALVRFGDVALVPPGAEADAVRSLPVAALGLSSEALAALSLAGLKRLGDLADLPSQPLAARFGEDLGSRLRRIQGKEDRRITPLRADPGFWADRAFAEPVAHRSTIEAALERLATGIGDRLETAGKGGRVFEASFFRSDGVTQCIAVRTGRPQRDPATILRLLHERLDALADPLDPGYGFDRIRLAAPVTEPFRPAQTRLDGSADGEDAVSDLVDRLAARLGRGRILRFVACDTHDPLRSARPVPVADEALSAAWPEPEPGEPPTRPLHLFDPPESLEVLAEPLEAAPLRFRWRGVLYTVMHVEGPERIAPEWWRGSDVPTRDYYRIENGRGDRFWIFSAVFCGRESGPTRWYLHGLFA